MGNVASPKLWPCSKQLTPKRPLPLPATYPTSSTPSPMQERLAGNNRSPMRTQLYTTTIHFAGTAVSIQTDQPALHHILQTQFHYCQSNSTPAKTTYTISQIEQLEPLMQQLVVALITDNNSHTIIHAGAIAINNKSILLCGASGSGKSTLSTWLVHQGAVYLTDEIIAIPQEEATITGFPRPIVLKEGVSFVWEKWLSSQQASHVLHLPAGIRWLTPDILEATVCQHPIQPHLILFPTYDPQIEFEIRPLTPAQSSFQLLQQTVNARNLSRWGIDSIKSITSNAQSYTMHYNNVDRVEKWLAQQSK